MASYFPMVKNSAQRIVFPILDADGDPVTGAATDTPDSEYSLDGGNFADITDEIHEIATASGVYYLDLAQAETNGDVVSIQIKTATATTKTTVLVFYTSAQSLDTVDGNVDAIKTAVEHATYGLSAIETLVDEAESLLKNATYGLSALKDLIDALNDPTAAVIADTVWDEVLTGAVHNIATSAGRRLREAADVLIAREETCQAGGANDEIILDAGASAVDNFYQHDIIVLISGAGVGQSRHIDSYVGATKTATVNRDWTTNPDATTGYIIRFDSPKHLHHIEALALAQIQQEAEDALAAYDPPTKTEMDNAHALLATVAKQDIIDGIVDDILEDTGITLPATLAAIIVAINAISIAAVAGAVWDELTADHEIALTFGEAVVPKARFEL